METIIASKKKTPIITVILLCFFILLTLFAIILSIRNKDTFCLIFFPCILFIEIVSTVITIVNISHEKKIGNILIIHKGKTFYFPTLMLKIPQKNITRVVPELKKIVYVPIHFGSSNVTSIMPIKNNVGTLHITFIYKGKEYYFKLKNVISPDLAGEKMRDICKLPLL